MSDEFALAQAMEKMAAVQAAGVAQRENERTAQEATNARTLIENRRVAGLNVRTNALGFAVRLNKAERTPEQVLEDADKFVAWLLGEGAQ